MASSLNAKVGLLLVMMSCTALAEAQEHTVKVLVINAKTGEPVSGASLTVESGSHADGPAALVTDRSGVVHVDPGKATTIRILTKNERDCRPPGESVAYSLAAIRRTGITARNVCGEAQNTATPGELILFETSKTPPPTVKIRIINARTGQPVTDEQLNVALRADQIGSVAMATDKQGIIDVDPGAATTIRILSNMYADCRPRGELYTDYPLAAIRKTGITTGNLCSSAQPAAKPGELILFEIPKTYIPTMKY